MSWNSVLTRTEWNGAVLPILVWSGCMAPGSSTVPVRIAAVVSCCLNTAVRKVFIKSRSWKLWSQRPRTARSSAHSSAHRSHVLFAFFSCFAICTKQTYTLSWNISYAMHCAVFADFNIAIRKVLTVPYTCYYDPELSVGPFSVTRLNPNQCTFKNLDPTQPIINNNKLTA